MTDEYEVQIGDYEDAVAVGMATPFSIIMESEQPY